MGDFADLAKADFLAVLSLDEGSEAVVYTPVGGEAAGILGLVDRSGGGGDFRGFDGGRGRVRVVVVRIALDAVLGVLVPALGDVVDLSEGSFRVGVIKLDGPSSSAWLTCNLVEQRVVQGPGRTLER